MKIRFNLRSFILTGTLTIILTLLGTTNSKAVLQANPTTHASPVSKAGASWITEIRQMETVGQTMGLSKTLNGLNATSTSNKIDVHMMLPTEYEAVAILSASGYGNSKKLTEESDALKRTTTGNSTGVYFTGDKWEMVASASQAGNTKYNRFSPGLYGWEKVYEGAMNVPGWFGWHSGGPLEGLNGTTYNASLITDYAFGGRGLFSIGYSRSDNGGAYWDGGFYGTGAASRGVAICGEGL